MMLPQGFGTPQKRTYAKVTTTNQEGGKETKKENT